MHVGDAALALEDAGALELDLLGGEAVEEAAPLAEQHRDDVELELVEDAGGERELRDRGAVDQHVPVAGGALGLGHRGRDVVHIGDQRPLADVDAGLTAAEDPDRHAVVVVAAPAAGRLEGPRPATTAPVAMNSSTTWPLAPLPAEISLWPASGRQGPLVQTVPAVAQPVVRSLVGPGDESVEGHGHVENGCGHGGSFFRSTRASNERPVEHPLCSPTGDTRQEMLEGLGPPLSGPGATVKAPPPPPELPGGGGCAENSTTRTAAPSERRGARPGGPGPSRPALRPPRRRR